MLFGPDRLFRLSVSFFRGDSLFLQECNWDAKFCFGHAGVDIFLRLNRVEALFFLLDIVVLLLNSKSKSFLNHFHITYLKSFILSSFILTQFWKILACILRTCLCNSPHISVCVCLRTILP